MNERIKELREQAWTIVSDEQRDHGELYETRDRWDRYDQKFAELIVQKCLYIVEMEDDCGPDTKSVRLAMKRMKQHFGIKL